MSARLSVHFSYLFPFQRPGYTVADIAERPGEQPCFYQQVAGYIAQAEFRFFQVGNGARRLSRALKVRLPDCLLYTSRCV